MAIVFGIKTQKAIFNSVQIQCVTVSITSVIRCYMAVLSGVTTKRILQRISCHCQCSGSSKRAHVYLQVSATARAICRTPITSCTHDAECGYLDIRERLIILGIRPEARLLSKCSRLKQLISILDTVYNNLPREQDYNSLVYQYQRLISGSPEYRRARA